MLGSTIGASLLYLISSSSSSSHQQISGSRPHGLYFHPTYLLWTRFTT